MAQILLDQFVFRLEAVVQNAFTLLRKIDKFEMTINGETKQIATWIEEVNATLGSYSEDTGDALDDTSSVIKNLVVLAENLEAVENILNDPNGVLERLDKIENDKADKTTTAALQDDIDNLLEIISGVRIDVPTPIDFTTGATRTADISGLDFSKVVPGQELVIKIKNNDGTSEYITESFNDGTDTNNSFFGEPETPTTMTDTTLTLSGLPPALRNVPLQIVMIRTEQVDAAVDVSSKANIDLGNVNVGSANATKHLVVSPTGEIIFIDGFATEQWVQQAITALDLDTKFGNKADKDLTNVNVGVANAGKFAKVKADGTLEYVDAPSGGGDLTDLEIIKGISEWLFFDIKEQPYIEQYYTRPNMDNYIARFGPNADQEIPKQTLIDYFNTNMPNIDKLPVDFAKNVVELVWDNNSDGVIDMGDDLQTIFDGMNFDSLDVIYLSHHNDYWVLKLLQVLNFT